MSVNGVCIASTADEHGPIYVYQTRTSRILSFDGEVQQGCMTLTDINGLAHGYTQAMMCALLFIPDVATASIMGLGAGSMVKNLLNSFSELDIHVVEYRTEVINTATKYFHLPEDKRLTIHIDDAVNYMRHHHVKSDIIFSDLYTTHGMETKQIHEAYLHDCKAALNNHGILVVNIWHESLPSPEALDTIFSSKFNNRTLRFEVESGNIIVLAFKNAMPRITRKELLARAKSLQQKMNIPLERYAKLLWSRQQHLFGLD